MFEDLDSSVAAALLGRLRSEAGAALVHDLDPDDRARLFDELPASVATALLAGLDPHERRMTQDLLGYPPESPGRRMTPEVAWVRAEATVGEAIERLRELGDHVETIYMVPVLGEGRHLEGVVSLRRLLTAIADAAAARTGLPVPSAAPPCTQPRGQSFPGGLRRVDLMQDASYVVATVTPRRVNPSPVEARLP